MDAGRLGRNGSPFRSQLRPAGAGVQVVGGGAVVDLGDGTGGGSGGGSDSDGCGCGGRVAVGVVADVVGKGAAGDRVVG